MRDTVSINFSSLVSIYSTLNIRRSLMIYRHHDMTCHCHDEHFHDVSLSCCISVLMSQYWGITVMTRHSWYIIDMSIMTRHCHATSLSRTRHSSRVTYDTSLTQRVTWHDVSPTWCVSHVASLSGDIDNATISHFPHLSNDHRQSTHHLLVKWS